MNRTDDAEKQQIDPSPTWQAPQLVMFEFEEAGATTGTAARPDAPFPTSTS